jgi:NADPH2:quinone reductase
VSLPFDLLNIDPTLNFHEVNPHDQLVRDIGLFLNNRLPAVISDDIAGIVAELGPEATGFKVGDRIFGQSDTLDHEDAGGLQQYALLYSDNSSKTPSIISDDEAATFPANIIAALVALFDPEGLGLPTHPNWHVDDQAEKALAATQLVIIGGGSNTGKFTIQLAALAGVGDIIVVAGTSSTKELKGYGATHIIDRHLSNEEIKSQVDAITNGNCIYVCDTVNRNHTLAVSILSATRRGKVVTLLRGEADESKIGEKKNGYDKNQILGSSRLKRKLCAPFWKALSGLIESGNIKPLGFQVIEGGLTAEGVNKLLDDYRDGKNPGKWNVHPEL